MSKCYFDINIDNNEVGRLEFDLYDDDVPKTVENFKELCLREPCKGYKGSCFHRIIPNFMAQGGDYTVGNGTGGRAIFDGGKFDDENFKRKHTKEGILSMANCGKNTNGSQFFITFGKTEWLDGRHVVFGEVVKGFDVLNQIKKVGTQDGKPTKKVIISDCGVL